MLLDIDDTATMTQEEAIESVLAAEKAAERAVERCKAEAAQQIQAARQKAQRITDRAEYRIATIHRICDQLTSDQVNHIEQAAEEPAKQLLSHQVDLTVTAAIVEKIAAMLTEDIAGKANQSPW